MHPSFSVLFRIKVTTLLDFLWVSLGRIFGARIFGGKKQFQLRDFDEILINRADRFGDAIISRPFLAVFARYVSMEAKSGNFKAPKIRVIASAYNKEFLKSLENEGVLVEVAAGVTSYDYDRSAWYAFKRLISGFLKNSSRIFSRKRSRLAFIDLVDSVTEWVEADFPGKMDSVWISSNRGPYSIFFDYTYEDRFSGSTKRNLIETYINLFSSAFSAEGLREMVYENMGEFYSGIASNLVKSTSNVDLVDYRGDKILCLVGVKEFRNFSVELWHKIIVAFAQEHPNREIDVIDAPDNLIRAALEKYEYPKNVRIIDNPSPKSLADFAEHISRNYALAFGVDGGGINALRPFMNVCVAYTLGNYEVWSAFCGAAQISEVDLGEGWVLLSAEVIPGNRQSWIFKKTKFLPSFQIPVGKECFDDLDVKKFVEELSKPQ